MEKNAPEGRRYFERKGSDCCNYNEKCRWLIIGMNESSMNVLNALIVWNLMFLTTALQYDCSKSEYERCVKIADPLIKEVRLIFPDNMQDIDLVCRTWNNFVDCLKKYTERCFTDQQRQQFNKAIENPIQSVHQMCTQPNYQKEYLQYAPCMKSTVVDNARCGPQYSFLVDQVDQGDVISKATLCCSHDRFKQCVLKETRDICDRGVQNGPASRFSAQIIDKALSFLQDQCFNYIPNSGDCATLPYDNSPFSNTLSLSTSFSDEVAAKEILPTRVTPPRPTSVHVTPTTHTQYDSTYLVSTQNLGSRTRPASYGRASSWSDATPTQNTQAGVSTVEYSLTPGLVSSSNLPSTTSTWAVVNAGSEPRKESDSTNIHSSTTWYPAAGSQLSNEVDEPNQLGLVKPNNNANALIVNTLLLIVLIAVQRF
ncbi:hypothetical protein RN001_010788 [Aquatica leii]|uniref:Uncharacterized protein n=1 Tax=Aquatica leii TaxID=1421715 RepID=A0AAN7SEP0_9COLE|nr:hypothetical protein RN001_010788 [Aquatica leii]